uniref:Low-complexity tail membrane protein n=1 Tax=Paulinella longichromatophora TaxID=1708747 RepID=A0A2H4ZNZ0_9EUKA|nr:hypothetical protein PLO_255 [Paulinella longichromatophora]
MKKLVKDQTQRISEDVSTSQIHPHSEFLLWLQLLGGTLLPIESLIILLIQSGAHTSPWPVLSRLLLWCLGALVPTVVFWYLPLDCWSLILIKIPIQSRSLQQKALSSLHRPLYLKLLQAGVCLPLLVLIERLDQISSEIISFSIFQEISPFLGFFITIILLTLSIYQWQQFIQAAWLMLLGHKHHYINHLTESKVLENKVELKSLSLGLPLLTLKSMNILFPNEEQENVR